MNWMEISIVTNDPGVEALTGALLNIGVSGIRVENSKDFEEFLEGTQTYWDYVDEDLMYLRDCETKVILYLPENSQGTDTMALLKQTINDLKNLDMYGSLEITVNNVKEEDWENNWKQFFKPLYVGEDLLIKPSWEENIDAGNRKVLQIDPGMSFGTGTHETTKMCLEVMQKFQLESLDVLDLGCGSGILSIGALLFGAKSATLVDIDQNSVRIAAENLEINGFDNSCYKTHCGDITSNDNLRSNIGKKYDFIFANIVADVLKAFAPYFAEFLNDDGKLIVSGIILERKDEVLDEIQKYGFKVDEVYSENAWACGVLSLNS